MRGKGDLSDFECGVVVDPRWAGLSVSGNADLLGFSDTAISTVTAITTVCRRASPNADELQLQNTKRDAAPVSYKQETEEIIVYSLHRLSKIRQQMIGKTLAGLMKQHESMDPAG